MDKRTLLFTVLLSVTLLGMNVFFHQQNTERKRVWLEQQQKRKATQEESSQAPSSFSPHTEQDAALRDAKEEFYMLETPYQQLLFSNHGGALAEINLPFASEHDSQSVVREIRYDQILAERDPNASRFPERPHYVATPSGKELRPEGKVGGFYPLIRRTTAQTSVQPHFYALNLLSSNLDAPTAHYRVTHFDARSITFESASAHRKVRKTYTVMDPLLSKEAPYTLSLEITVEGDSRDLWLSSGVPEVEWISGAPAPSLKYRYTKHGDAAVDKIDLPSHQMTVNSAYPDWISNSNGFLGLILNPSVATTPGYQVRMVSGADAPSRLLQVPEIGNRYSANDLPGYLTLLPLPQKGGKTLVRVFAGPFDTNILKQVDALYTDPKTGDNPDYLACQTMHGWFTFISWPFAKFLSVLMDGFYWITGSWGISIFLLTIALRLMLYPLNAWSTKSMLKMQQIAPQVTALQEKHKNDPKKAQMEIVELYRSQGVNPASGCLPLLIQMPFLIGMFDLLKSSFALRGAPFIPGWIDDLSAPDVLFSWSQPILFFGTSFHLLPFLLGAAMLLQQRLSSALNTSQSLTDQQRQQRAMSTMMAGVFTLMFYSFPSGLNLYWLFSTLLGMGQQWYTSRALTRATPHHANRARKGLMKS